MTINLQKGQKAELTKGTGIKKIKVCLGWDTNKYDGGKNFDLDASAFLLNKDGKLESGKDVVFYNNLRHSSGSVIHSGDNLTGAGEGDDEVIIIDLDKVSDSVEKISMVVTIFKAAERKQNFGMVSNSFARVVNADTNQEILRYELGEDFSIETSVVVGEVYRHNGEWKFNAIGSGHVGDLETLIKKYQ